MNSRYLRLLTGSLLACALASVLAACTAVEPNYTNAAWGISLWYPEDWTYEVDNRGTPAALVFTSSSSILEGGPMDTGAVMLVTRPSPQELALYGPPSSLEELLEAVVSELVDPYLSATNRQSRTIGGQPGMILSVEGIPIGASVPVKGLVAVTEHRGEHYAFMLLSTSSQWPVYRPVLEQMLNSVTFSTAPASVATPVSLGRWPVLFAFMVAVAIPASLFVYAMSRQRRGSGVGTGATLRIVSGSQAGASMAIDRATWIIGRGQACDLPLGDSRVSRQHARLAYGRGAWFVQDLSSRNGTFVNGQRVEARLLRDGDQMTVGQTTMQFSLGRAPARLQPAYREAGGAGLGLNLKAIVLGVVATEGTGILIGLVLGFGVGFQSATTGQDLASLLLSLRGVMYLANVISALVGGWVTYRLGKEHPFWNLLAMSTAVVLITLATSIPAIRAGASVGDVVLPLIIVWITPFVFLLFKRLP